MKVIEFIREFQLWIVVMILTIITFILSLMYNDEKEFPLTFAVGGLIIVGVIIAYALYEYVQTLRPEKVEYKINKIGDDL